MPNEKAEEYRSFTREFRAQAERSPEPEIKKALIRTADQYERLASFMEEPPKTPER